MTLAQSHPAPDDTAPRAGDADADEALVRYVTRLGAARAGHHAVQFHLSRITRHYRTRKHLRVAASMLKELMAPLRPPFLLKNGDIVLIGKDFDQKKVAESTEMLSYLLSGEPLARPQAGETPLFTIYDLETHYRILLGSVRHIADAEARADAVRRPAKSAFQPARIGALVERLGQLELANMVRQQTVWTIPATTGEPQPQPLFDELYISVDGLREALGITEDIAEDPQFFQLVTRAFDKYMLSTLLRDRSAEKRPISINVNLQTLLSPEFLKFEHQRPSGWHGQIILEVQFANVWTDLAAFLSVARAAKDNGFSCCIDGVSHHALPLVNFHRLEADYIKVVWDDALLQLDESSLRDVCRAFNACGRDRAILTRCGRQEALQFGLAANLRMFQGWYVDGIGRKAAALKKPARAT